MRWNWRRGLGRARNWRQNPEEGQALVIVAVAMLALTWLLGLAIDVQLGNLEAEKLKTTVENAASSGGAYLIKEGLQGDYYARTVAEAAGYKVVCYYDSSKPDSDPYNQRCRRADLDTVRHGQPGQFFYYDSTIQVDSHNVTHYTVTVAKLQSRFLLASIGFPDYMIQQSATVIAKPPPVGGTRNPNSTPAAGSPTVGPGSGRGQVVIDPAEEIRRMIGGNSGPNGQPAGQPSLPTNPPPVNAGGNAGLPRLPAQQVCQSLKQSGMTQQQLPSNCR